MLISYTARASSLILILVAIAGCSINAEKTNDKIYSILQSNHYCGRRLNATNQMGCSSNLGGNFGIVWIVETDADIKHILERGPTPPYIAVLGRKHFTRSNLLTFRERSDRVQGVIFLDDDHEDSKSRSMPFSPEDLCPNRNSGLYANHSDYGHCKQNFWLKESPISGLLYDDIPYPIFLINKKESIDEIQTCFKTHNVLKQQRTEATQEQRQAPYPLCGLQLDSFMTAAQDSDLCLNSHFLIDEFLQTNGKRCDTVENHNIFAYYKTASGPLRQRNGTNKLIPDISPPRSVVMLVAKLSSLSMFSDISPGADSTITSIITLLTVAQALGQIKSTTAVQNSDRNIAFALFDSEPFDYTGSNRMIYDMINNTFLNAYFLGTLAKPEDAVRNLNLKSIDYLINLDQMASYPNADSIHFHSEPDDPNKDKLSMLFDVMQKVAAREKINLNKEDPKLPLPPASVQEFIRHSRVENYSPDEQLTGVVLSNYGKTYSNQFYHSIYDDSHNIFQTSRAKLVEHITHVSKFIAKSLYELAFKSEAPDHITVDTKLIQDLLQCYLDDASCHLFTRASAAGQKMPTGPIQTYKDPTQRSEDMNGAITAHLLAYFLGDVMTEHNLTKCIEDNQKSLIYNFEYINGKDEVAADGNSGVCIRSQVFVASAQSPAFSYSQEGTINIDKKYPAWTVSLNSIRNPVRLYLKPSPMSQWATFVLGIVITIASFIIVHEFKKNLNKIQSDNGNMETATST